MSWRQHHHDLALDTEQGLTLKSLRPHGAVGLPLYLRIDDKQTALRPALDHHLSHRPGESTQVLETIRRGAYYAVAPGQEPIPFVAIHIGTPSTLRRALHCRDPAIPISAVFALAKFAMGIPFWMMRPSPLSAQARSAAATTGPPSSSFSPSSVLPSQRDREPPLVVLVPYYELPQYTRSPPPTASR